jgi:Domain of Unknown Function (DUF1080)
MPSIPGVFMRKISKSIPVLLCLTALLLLTTIACFALDDLSAADATAAEPFLGRWDITVKTPTREYPAWLEIRLQDGKLTGLMVGQWAHAVPVLKIEVAKDVLSFLSPQEQWDRKDNMPFEGKLTGGHLSGTTKGPDGSEWTWTAQRAPDFKRKTDPKWGKPSELFNGKDLTGWHEDKPKEGKTWTVSNGLLVTPGNGPELINNQKFRDFKLHVEFNCGPNSNSGVYLRGRYEVQIETNSPQEPPSHHTGGVYGFIDPNPEQPRASDTWQTFDITLVGRTITVVQNGKTIIDKQEIPGITGGALNSHEGEPGPIYLQGSEDGHVQFRRITITPAVE